MSNRRAFRKSNIFFVGMLLVQAALSTYFGVVVNEPNLSFFFLLLGIVVLSTGGTLYRFTSSSKMTLAWIITSINLSLGLAVASYLWIVASDKSMLMPILILSVGSLLIEEQSKEVNKEDTGNDQ